MASSFKELILTTL